MINSAVLNVTFRELKQTLFTPITWENTSKRQVMKNYCLTPRADTNISETRNEEASSEKNCLLSFYGAKLTFAALYKVSEDVNVGLLSLDLNVRNVEAKWRTNFLQHFYRKRCKFSLLHKFTDVKWIVNDWMGILDGHACYNVISHLL